MRSAVITFVAGLVRMYTGFPSTLVPLLRCPLHDCELLLVPRDRVEVGDRLIRGELRCHDQGHEYRIREGILDLVNEVELDTESAYERRLRDDEAERYDRFTGSESHSAMEMLPMLSALAPLERQTVLELGCGTGRFTLKITPEVGAVLAVDFSLESLRVLASRLPDDAPVGLAHADVTKLAVAPAAFDRVLSTLVSNLPTPAHRAAMFRLAAHALRETGRGVFGAHHYRIRDRLAGERQAGRYNGDGIFRYLFRRAELLCEARSSFRQMAVRPIQIYLPLASRGGALSLSRLCERVPLLNLFGLLLLLETGQPIRPDPAHAS
jgi:SAM-dependent methyltransferase/uncharacterized protein YbaR (Trm112 family)